MSDDEPEGEPAVTVRGRRLGDHAIMNLELLAGLFGLGRTLLDNASEAVKTLLHSRFRIPFEALEWGTETVSADVLAAATGIGESELAQRVTAEALALADRVAITVQAFLEGKQLLGEVEVTHSGWHRGDDDVMREVKGTYKGKRVRVARFVDSAGNAKLETVTVDGEARELLAFDVLLAEFFAELGTPEAKATAAKIRKTPPEERGKRWKAATTPDGGPLGPRACLAVFQAVWAKLKDERAAPVYKLMHVEHLGSSYVQAPKVLGGITWAFGTDGQRVVDGDEYRAAPKVARYVSRSIGLVPEGRLKQGLLAVETTTEALAVRVLADSQAVVSGVGGKVALLLAVLSPEGSGLCRMTVDELCRMLWPAAKRGPQLRDRQAAVKAALALRELFVVLPNTVNFRLWDIAAPAAKAPTGELPITFGWSKNAEAEELGGMAAGMLRGRFLLNLSGAMRLSADHALELRTYLHAAAGWNEARRSEVFEPKFAPMGTAEEIAARVNALSAPAVQYLSEQGKGRRQAAADDKRRLTEALERLADEAGLIRLEKAGRVLRLLPPGGLLEAYELMRKDGRRPVR